MRIERIGKRLEVWETGRKENEICYDSESDKSKYKRRNLSFIENFLRENGEIEEAEVIKLYLGKILRNKTIPQLIPTGNYIVNHHLDKLKDTIERYVEEYGLNLDPDFQRGHVWTMQQRLKYVEFILQGGKSNPIYMNHEGWMKSWNGEMVIVDGKQRLTSLLMFLNDKFPVFKELDNPRNIGYYASEFDFIPHDIPVVINDLEGKDKVLEWYLQINRGNIAHTESVL